jgi:hypothetical protein
MLQNQNVKILKSQSNECVLCGECMGERLDGKNGNKIERKTSAIDGKLFTCY